VKHSDTSLSALGTEFVTVLVGHKKKETSFHKKLLTSRSTAFDNHMKALKDKGRYQYHCESRFENAFTILVTYLYKGYVPTGPLEDGPGVSTYGRQMRELYYLAERFEIHDLMDKTLDAIQPHDHRHSRDMCKYIGEIYMNTSRDSKLRLYGAVSVAWNFGRLSSTSEGKLSLIETFSDRAEILSDILKALVTFQTSIANASIDYRIPSTVDGLGPCHFHSHAKDVTCHREHVLEAKEDTQHMVKAERTATEAVRGESIGLARLDDDNDMIILTKEKVEEMARKKVREGKRPARDEGPGGAVVDHIPGIQESDDDENDPPAASSSSPSPAPATPLPVYSPLTEWESYNLADQPRRRGPVGRNPGPEPAQTPGKWWSDLPARLGRNADHIVRIMETDLGEKKEGEEKCEECQGRSQECWVYSEMGTQQISRPGDQCARCREVKHRKCSLSARAA
jgi:hypothetical protein